MAFMETASDLKACEAVRALIPCFEDCRQRVEAIRETFEDRTTALLHYQIACDVYDEVIEMHGRAMANIHQECLEAGLKRENRRKVYDLIVERMREEYPRWHASIGADMTHSLRAFAKTRAALCRRDAECWEMMLRDPPGDGVKMDDVMRVDDRHEEHELEVVSRYDDHVKPQGKLLSTKEKLLLEKNARRIQQRGKATKRGKRRGEKYSERGRKEAKMAIANGQSVPEMPEYYEKKMRTRTIKKKSADSDDDAENRNEENKKNDEGGKAAARFSFLLRGIQRE